MHPPATFFRRSALLTVTVAALALAACGANPPTGTPGTEGAACLADRTCDGELVCGSPCWDPGLDPPFTDHSGCVERCLVCDAAGNASPDCPQPDDAGSSG